MIRPMIRSVDDGARGRQFRVFITIGIKLVFEYLSRARTWISTMRPRDLPQVILPGNIKLISDDATRTATTGALHTLVYAG